MFYFTFTFLLQFETKGSTLEDLLEDLLEAEHRQAEQDRAQAETSPEERQLALEQCQRELVRTQVR